MATKRRQLVNSAKVLAGNLTVEDARHLLNNEGGELTSRDIATQIGWTLVVAATTARALWTGNATVWHLALPMVAQYLALIAALPLFYLFVREPGLRKDSWGAVRLWVGFAASLAVATLARAKSHEVDWQRQLHDDVLLAWRWIVDAQMQWPMAAAALNILQTLPGRIRNLQKYGPPFVGVGLGCAMRFVVLLLGCFIIPMAAGSSTRMAWFLWAVIVLSDACALWMHWDIQSKLRALDGGRRDDADRRAVH